MRAVRVNGLLVVTRLLLNVTANCVPVKKTLAVAEVVRRRVV
jgi:hypothetical protein